MQNEEKNSTVQEMRQNFEIRGLQVRIRESEKRRHLRQRRNL